MPLRNWLKDFRSSLSVRRTVRRPNRLKNATVAAQTLEHLEDRQLMSATNAVGLDQKAFDLDQDLELRKSGSYHEDYRGLGEKWIRSDAQQKWYYITPNGGLYDAKTATLVQQFDASFHADPSKLHDALDPATRGMNAEDLAWHLDRNLELAKRGSYHENYRGLGEKWVWSWGEKDWYYITPDGSVTNADTRAIVGKLTPEYHKDPTLLHSPVNPATKDMSAEDAAWYLDQNLELAKSRSYHERLSRTGREVGLVVGRKGLVLHHSRRHSHQR